MNWAIIANPVSGRGQARRWAARLASSIEAIGDHVTLAWTAAPDHATELAREAVLAGGDRVVACGGDGTIHQVINGMMSAGAGQPSAALGILPLGRCNDLASYLRMPQDPEKAIAILLYGAPQPMDLGRAGDRYFATVATLGFDTEVGRYVADGRHPSFLKGRAAYVYASLVKLASYKDVEVHLKGDFGEYQGSIFLAATGNIPHYGGGMKIAPSAVADDGRLDLCLVRSTSRWSVLWMFPRVFGGGHISHPAVTLSSLQRMEITSSVPLWIWADGEAVAQTPITLEVVHHAVSVLVPQMALSDMRPLSEGVKGQAL